MDLAGFCDKNIIVSDEALHCGGGRGCASDRGAVCDEKERRSAHL